MTLHRTGQTFSSWDALAEALLEGDVVTVVGELQGPLSVRCAGVTLQGTSYTQRFVILAPKRATTLSVGAHRFTVRFAIIHATPFVSTSLLLPTVLVQAKVKRFRMEHCDIVGAGAPRFDKSACGGVAAYATRCAEA